MRIGIVVATLAAGVMTACAGLTGSATGASSALQLDVPVRAGARPLQRAGQPLRARINDFTDARPGAGSRKVGNIRATVRDMHGTELLLDRKVETQLTEVTRAQLAADGIAPVEPGGAADFTVDGAVTAFSLEVAGRDERNIAVEITLRDAKNGSVIWAGRIAEQDDRYAGVAGNSRATIAAYLSEGVASYATRLSAALREGLLKIYPDSVESVAAARLSALPGVTTLQVPVPVSAPVPTAPIKPSTAVGHFSVQTVPPRARVYIGDVYYGMSPLRLELPAGIANFSFKLGGYRPVAEKVSIRPGETTELELTLEKQ